MLTTWNSMELTRQFGGNDAPLVGLLRVYKDYYPDVIVREAVAGRAKVFTVCNIFTIAERQCADLISAS
jgi:hypothetical protein